jgi:hypothetical protein
MKLGGVISRCVLDPGCKQSEEEEDVYRQSRKIRRDYIQAKLFMVSGYGYGAGRELLKNRRK